MRHGMQTARGSWARRVRFSLAGLTLGLGAVVLTYRTVPDHNSNASHFATLIVLGSPPDPDGKPSPEQRERVMEAVREFDAGRADAIIVSGGETLPGLFEADTMALVAREAGVAPDKIIEERQALNTVQNIFFSHRIMQQRGWTTAEVVSSPSHLPRAALILEHWRFGWRVQAARWPESYTFQRIAPYYVYEALGTTALRWFGFRRSPFLPAALTPQTSELCAALQRHPPESAHQKLALRFTRRSVQRRQQRLVVGQEDLVRPDTYLAQQKVSRKVALGSITEGNQNSIAHHFDAAYRLLHHRLSFAPGFYW